MSDSIHLTNKKIHKNYLDAFMHPDADKFSAVVSEYFAENAEINVVHPFNEMSVGSYIEEFLNPLLSAFDGLFRRDYILMGGEYEESEWVSSTGYYVGHFANDWLGIKATQKLSYLRVGEFHRYENGKIVESYIYLDIPELMIACNQWPDIQSPAISEGYTGMLPGPASLDGFQLHENEVSESDKSYHMVTDMLRKLATKEEAWRPYWHENMVWYGPAAFGSFVGKEKFHSFQVPFESCFSHWIGGSVPGSETKHFIRHADGNYICSGGWPSLNAHQVKPFLSQPATNKNLYMRVCDWWRREGDLLVENWVFVDIPHVLLQMDYDLFAEIKVRRI